MVGGVLLVAAAVAAAVLLGRSGRSSFPEVSGFEPPLRGLLAEAIAGVEENDSAGAWGRLGMVCQAHGLHGDARRAYRKARQKAPASSRWAHLDGMAAELLSLPAEAEASYRRAHELDPQDIVAICSQARLLARRGKLAPAAALYETALTVDPTCVAALVGQGQIALREERLEEAESALQQALDHHPPCGPAHSGLASLYHRRGDAARAAFHRGWSQLGHTRIPLPDAHLTAVDALGVTYPTHLRRGRAAASAGRWPEAVEHYRQAVQSRGDLPDARYSLGVSLLQTGAVEAARRELETVAAGGERRVDALRQLARLEAKRGSMDAAHRVLDQAAVADARDPLVHVARGSFHRHANERDEALEAYEAALGIDRACAPAYEGRGAVLLDLAASRDADDVRYALEADFVVGCDGGNSFVRKTAGLALEDLSFDEPWLVVDATIDGTPSDHGLPNHPHQRCDPARPVTFVPVAGPYIRWEFMLRPGESGDEMMNDAQVSALIGEWTDPTGVRVIRRAVYDFHAVLAERWSTGRVFLAGDAAHQMPPFLGQGLCTGMRDVANLAWKLERVLRGGAPFSLLASYESERKEQARTVVQLAIQMGRIVCTQDPEAAAARDADWLSREERVISPPPFPGLGSGFFLEGAPLAGARALQAPVHDAEGEAQAVDAALGSGFGLLRRGESGALGAVASRARDAHVTGEVDVSTSRDPSGAYAAWMNAHGVDAVLVRPDRAVFGGASGDGAANALLEALDAQLSDER